MSGAGDRAPVVLVDAHVHLHACFPIERALDAAAYNFAAAAGARSCGGEVRGVLCLAETAGVDRFAAMHAAAARGDRFGPWTAQRTAEPCSVALQGPAGAVLLVIAARQVVTRERLEVLALGTAAPIEDGRPLAATLDAVLEAGAAPVLPWGVGKWRGARGASIDAVIAQSGRRVHLGDNGNRLEWGAAPPQFEAARHAGLKILPGSDPLPLRGEEQRIGAYGFRAPAALAPDRPAAGLLALLAAQGPVSPYGQRERLGRFMRNQLAMQIAKRRAA